MDDMVQGLDLATLNLSSWYSMAFLFLTAGLAYDQVKSWFPSSCNQKYLVYDQRQKTQDFSCQYTENGLLNDDNKNVCEMEEVCEWHIEIYFYVRFVNR